MFGVAGKRFLIILLRRDLRVDLGSLNGTETINLFIFSMFSNFSVDKHGSLSPRY